MIEELEIKHSLFLRKNGRWCMTVVPAGGTWEDARQLQAPKQVAGGSTERPSPAAKKWRDHVLLEVRMNGGQPPKKKTSSPTLRECHERVMKKREGLPKVKTSTIKNNWTHLRAQILPLDVNADPAAAIADVPMAEIGVARASAFVRSVRERNSPNHARNIYSTMCLLWDTAQGMSLIGPLVPNPFRNTLVVAELPRQENLEDDDGEPITIPLPAMQALFVVADELVPLERKARYALAVLSGTDDGEIAGFTWAHAKDLPSKQLALPETATPATPHIQVRKQISLRGKAGYATEDSTKTTNRVRDIPLHPAAVAALDAWRDRWEQLMRRKPRPKDYVFPTLEGTPARPPSASLLRHDLRVVNALAMGRGEPPLVGEELLGLITFKSARRTFSTALKAASVDEETRGKLMGHAGKTVTARNYTAHEIAQLAEQIARIPLVWPSVEIAVTTGNAASQEPIATSLKVERAQSVESRRGWDSNPRMTVLQSDPTCGGEDREEPPSYTKCGVDGASTVGMSGDQETRAASPADDVTGVSVAAADVATPVHCAIGQSYVSPTARSLGAEPKFPQPSPEGANRAETPVESNVSARAETAFHQPSTTPLATSRDAGGGITPGELDSSTGSTADTFRQIAAVVPSGLVDAAAALAVQQATWDGLEELAAREEVGDRDVKPSNIPGPAKARERGEGEIETPDKLGGRRAR